MAIAASRDRFPPAAGFPRTNRRFRRDFFHRPEGSAGPLLLFIFILACVLLSAGQPGVAGQTKYGVTVKTVNQAALAKAKTYMWTKGQPSADKNIDAMIVAAVDRELAAHGLTKLTSGPSDILVTYASLMRTDVDLGKVKPGETPPELAIGSLTVDLSDPTSRQMLFSVRMDTPIERNMATIEATIGAATKAMFEKYPSPKR